MSHMTNLAAKVILQVKLSRDQIPHGMIGDETSRIVLTLLLSMKGLASLQCSSKQKIMWFHLDIKQLHSQFTSDHSQ